MLGFATAEMMELPDYWIAYEMQPACCKYHQDQIRQHHKYVVKTKSNEHALSLKYIYNEQHK